MLGINSHALPVQGIQHNYGLLSVSVGAKRVAQTTRRTRRLTFGGLSGIRKELRLRTDARTRPAELTIDER